MNDTDFDQLIGGVNEVIAHLEGKQTLRKTVIAVPDEPPAYTAEDVRKLREALHLSQGLFARVLNVSVNTVRKWEQGERHPSGPSARLLQIAQTHPEYLLKNLKARSVA
ncbi:MAG: helix-turn-helix domain-containing protein [Opitutales bacterium]